MTAFSAVIYTSSSYKIHYIQKIFRGDLVRNIFHYTISGKAGKMGKFEQIVLEPINIIAKSAAREQLLKQLYQQRLKYLCMLGKADEYVQNVYNEVETLKNEYLDKKDNETAQILFITINPDPNIVGDYMDVKEIKKLIQQITKKKWLQRYLYSIEQRGDTEETQGYRPHIHLLFFRDGKRPSHAIREIQRNVQHITDIHNDAIFNVQFCNDQDDNIKRLINYLLGQKKAEIKHKKQEIDKLWRTQNNIEPYYQNNFLRYIQEYNNATQEIGS